MVAKTYLLFGGYCTTIKSPPVDLFRHVICPGRFSNGTLDILLLRSNMQQSVPEISITFLQIFRKPSLWSWTWLYIWKANETLIPTISCPYGNTVSFHVRVKYISVWKIRYSAHSNQWGCKCQKSPKQPLPFGAHELPSNTWMPEPTPFTTPNDSWIGSHTSTQRCKRVPIGCNGTPQFHPSKLPFPSTITTLI